MKKISILASLLILVLVMGTMTGCGSTEAAQTESEKECTEIVEAVRSTVNACTKAVVASSGSQLTMVNDTNYIVYYCFECNLYKATVEYDPDSTTLAKLVKKISKQTCQSLNGQLIAENVISFIPKVGTDSATVQINVEISDTDSKTIEENFSFSDSLKESMASY